MTAEHHHFVQHFLQPGDYVRTEFTCTAPQGATCRMTCRRCSDRQYESCICASLGETPDLADFGCCLVMTWLGEDAGEEMYHGEPQPVRGPAPQPIVTEWNGDNYEWDYAT